MIPRLTQDELGMLIRFTALIIGVLVVVTGVELSAWIKRLLSRHGRKS